MFPSLPGPTRSNPPATLEEQKDKLLQGGGQVKKRQVLVADLSELQLGPTTNGKILRIAVDVKILLPDTEPRTLRALYDSGAELNLINANTVKRWNIPSVDDKEKPRASFLDAHSIRLRSAHELTVEVADKHGTRQAVGPERFWAADFQGYDLILGCPWLYEADPKIRFRDGTFEW